MLYLRPGTREHFLENLARDWPELLPRYQRLYAGRAYLGKKEVEPVRREVADLRHRFEVGDRRPRSACCRSDSADAQLGAAAAGQRGELAGPPAQIGA